ncbi:hypothetical protein GDO81_000146 [Engystomops pustulosus]|uniref:CCDC113/CCDC96 coiled-coil domain-containing protein n=1 Tax=Engystomops pustulosus TaxID=76066 RepID=A0AAV7D547_ENGPU|nr:hypothetical protein GDO81_000146 [Engystomops pustulosus]
MGDVTESGERRPGSAQEPEPNTELGTDLEREEATRLGNASVRAGRQKDGERPGTSQEGSREPGTSEEGAQDQNVSTEDTREPGTIDEDTTDLTIVQESAGHIEGTKLGSAIAGDDMVAVTENSSSWHQEEEPEGPGDDSSEPHHITEEYSEISKDDEDQEPPLEEQGEGEEETVENQDPELQEEVDDEEIREQLILQYHSLVQERDKIHQQNSQLQHKLYEYFRKKKGEETRTETSTHATDQEQRYLKYLNSLEEMRRTYKEEAAMHQQHIEELRAQCQDIVSKVNKEWADFQEQKKKIALCSLSKRGGGKHAASSLIQETDLLLSREDRKEKEVIQVRLENIKLKNQISRYESTLRSKEELAEGLHLIDFEQLKIENQTYNEKIEERNEELLKLRKKITNTVQVLTHVKEKLQYVQAENQEQKEKLMEVEALVGNKRDILTKTKQARDSLRMENLKLKQKCGLLGNKVLLRDFEDKVDTTEELKQTLENLKRRHAELTLSSKGLTKKINEAQTVMEGYDLTRRK